MHSSADWLLLVEDDANDQWLDNRALGDLSPLVKTVFAEDGEQALNLLHQTVSCNLPRLVISDLKLPKVCGKDLLTFIKKDQRLAHIPVVIFSSSFLEHEVESCKALGASDFVQKPFEMDEYIKTLRAIPDRWIRAAVKVA